MSFYTQLKRDQSEKFSPLSNQIFEQVIHNIPPVSMGDGNNKKSIRRYATEPCKGGFICPLCSMKDPLIEMVDPKLRYNSRGEELHFNVARKAAILGWSHTHNQPRILVASKSAMEALFNLQEEGEDITNYTFKFAFSQNRYSATNLSRVNFDMDLEIEMDHLLDMMEKKFREDYMTSRSREDLLYVVDPTTTTDRTDEAKLTTPPPRNSSSQDLRAEFTKIVEENLSEIEAINSALEEHGIGDVSSVSDENLKEAITLVKSSVSGF